MSMPVIAGDHPVNSQMQGQIFQEPIGIKSIHGLIRSVRKNNRIFYF
ncbi:MAG: hypothetical protein ACI8Z1_000685 [Candidatus Azotimanducaceae bacterium]|jgi:hypothetical protein